MSGKLRPKTQDLRPKTRKTKTRKTKTRKTKTRKTKTRKTKTRKTKTRKTKTLFFLGEIIKFQLSSPLSGKMNEINALTLTDDNLVVLLFPCMANETISGCRGVAFSLCTKVWRNKAKQCFVYFAKR